jgi:hypothetical protein
VKFFRSEWNVTLSRVIPCDLRQRVNRLLTTEADSLWMATIFRSRP